MSDYRDIELPDLNAAEDEKKKKPRGPAMPDLAPLPDLTKVTTGEDVLKTLPWIGPKAGAAFVGAPKDLSSLIDMGGEYLRGKLGMKPESDMQKEFRSAASPLGALTKLPGSQFYRDLTEKATGVPWYDPVTRTGKVVDTAGQAALSMGRSLWKEAPKKAATLVAGQTAGTEGAGAAFEGTKYEPWARFVGGIVGGAGPTIHNAMKGAEGSLARKFVGDKPSDVDIAQWKQNQADNLKAGYPALGSESTGMGHHIVGQIGSSLGGGTVLENFLKKRPTQMSDAVNNIIGGAIRNADTPPTNAARAQLAATESIAQKQKARSRAVDESYEKAKYETLPANELRPFHSELVNQILAYPEASPMQGKLANWHAQAFPGEVKPPPEPPRWRPRPLLKEFGPEPPPAPREATRALPETNIGVLGKLEKKLGIESDKPPVGAGSDVIESTHAAGQLKGVLSDILTRNSPALREGKAKYKQFTEDVIEPMRSGPVGTLAGMHGVDPADVGNVRKVTGTIGDPVTAHPRDIETIYTTLNKTDPKAFPGMAKNWITQLLDESAHVPTGEIGHTAGAKFANALTGTPDRKARFETVMRGVADAHGANPDELITSVRKVIDAFDRTKMTKAPGPPTKGEVAIEGKPLVGVTEAVGNFPAAPLAGFAAKREGALQRMTNRKLADVLTDEASVQKLLAMAKVRPNGLAMRYLLANLLGFDNAASSSFGP